MNIARVFKWWHGIIRHRYFEFKIYASIVTNAFCGLHNDKYTKFQPCENCELRACSHTCCALLIYYKLHLLIHRYNHKKKIVFA